MKARPNLSGPTGRRTGSPSLSRSPDFGQRQLAVALNEQRNAFKAFLVARVGNEAEAEDILQNGLMKAIQRAGELHDDTKLTAWFYRLLRNAIVDHYRTKAAARRRDDILETSLAALEEDIIAAPPGWETQLCTCLGTVVDTLKPQYAELLRRVDLNGEPVQAAAKALGLTANNASVILHRARRDLRVKLQAFCGACADGACLDCHCAPVPDSSNQV
jgi:RNA polymerase sigma-70 factor (ECF subfamily)